MSVVLITGASTGFGRLTAEEFAAAGDTVVATMRNPQAGAELVAKAEAEGWSVEVQALDVTVSSTIDEAVADVLNRHGRIDVLVNNAGVGVQGPIEEVSDAETRAAFDVNVFGVLAMMRAVLPAMRDQGSGAIANVSSTAGVVSTPFDGIYSATKWAVEALTEAAHFELKQFGIRVTSIEPGGFETNFDSSRIRAEGFGESSPYHDVATRFLAARGGIGGRGAKGPELVAQVIRESVTTDTPRLRWPVGDDADLITAVRVGSDFETYEQTIRTALDFWE
ncbi:MAG: SDR family oxidoreductase [Actinomycetia bacterium]|nr:SDR family oxidoreductase [Actinomycetes bacterium]